jgi:hypothetical protein
VKRRQQHQQEETNYLVLDCVSNAAPLTIQPPLTSTTKHEIDIVQDEEILDDSMLNSAVSNSSLISHQTVDEEILLVFWPPVQRQSKPINNHPFVMTSNENLLICLSNTDIDLFPALTWTGFMDVFDKLGFQVQVKRSAKGAKIRLCINHDICTQRESYSISVNIDQCVITGADYNGLFYGVLTFLQLLQLHSLISRDIPPDQSHLHHVHPHGQVITHIKIPAIQLYDFPSLTNRAVLWSQRQFVLCQQEYMQQQISLYSRLRINNISLVVDVEDRRLVAEDVSSIDIESTNTINSTSSIVSEIPSIVDEDNNPNHAFFLDELCDKHCISLVPTVIISSIHDRFDFIDLLMREVFN